MAIVNQQLPLVAIVGRPNVGKSTLFNRLVGGRPALVEDVPGVTRDRRYGEAEFGGQRFNVVDTGGLDPGAEEGVIGAGIHRQARRAIDEADLILFVLDAREGLTPVDQEVARMLRKAGRPVVVVANKIDGAQQESLTGELYALGLGEVFPMSATHGRGSRELLDEILARIYGSEEGAPREDEEPPTAEGEPAGGPIRLAFVGRPNVGKSSLVNRLLGEERVLVHDAPGTTTDPVDTAFAFGGQEYVLVDTAGIRKRARVDEPTEKISVSMALGQIERADVVALVIDASEGAAEQDAKIGGKIEEGGAAVLILVNKDDLIDGGKPGRQQMAKIEEKIRDTMQFLTFAPICFVSAKTGHGVTDALAVAKQCFENHGKRISTSELNKFFTEVCETTPPPTFRSRPVRIYYLTQVAGHPPTFVLWANRPELVHYAYRRFLMNKLRDRFGFEGTPVRIITRRRSKGKGDRGDD